MRMSPGPAGVEAYKPSRHSRLRNILFFPMVVLLVIPGQTAYFILVKNETKSINTNRTDDL